MQPSSGKYYGAAAQYNKTPGLDGGKLLKIAGLIVGVIVLITVGYFAFVALTSGNQTTTAQLVARQKQLLSFASTNQANLTNDNLKTANSNAVSLFSSDSYSLQQTLKSVGLSTVPDTIAKTEVDSTSATTLATAKVQHRFDQVYVQLLRDKIAATQSLARSVLGGANGSARTNIQTVITNLTAVDNQLASVQL